MSYPTFTTATTFLDHLRPPFEAVVEYEVPTSAQSTEPTYLSSQNSILQSSHASQSICHFPPTTSRGFIKASVVNDGYSLELRWLGWSKCSSDHPTDQLDEEDTEEDQDSSLTALDKGGCHTPVQFRFPDKIIPTPYLATDIVDGTLIILVLTDAGILYRLKFTVPLLFYAELFEEDWSTDIEIEAIANRMVILYHGIDANNLVIASSDGILTHLSWGKLVGIDDAYGWKSSNLTTRPGLWGLLPTWSSSKTVSSSAHEWVATPGSTISISSHVTAGGSGEDGWIFTISRDRKLRVWSLASGECLREVSLGTMIENKTGQRNHLIGHNSLSDERSDTSLLPAAPRSLTRFVYADEGDDSSYEGFLVVFVPSAVSPSFITYGMSMTSDQRFSNLILLEERHCDPRMFGNGELRDFQISRVDLAHPQSTSPLQKPWGLWTVWDDEVGGEGILRYTVLHETRNWQEVPRTEWVTIVPPDRATPWNSTYFDDLLTNSSNLSVSEVFIEHLFKPGHYSSSTLEYALATYEEQLSADPDHGSGLQTNSTAFESLEEKICALVGSNVRLEISAQTGSPMMDVFHRKLRIEWLKFAAMCSESRASALWPIELAVNPDRHMVFVIGRRSITAPVLIDTASLLIHITREEAAGLEPVLLQQSLPVIDKLHPLLSNLNNRVDLVNLVKTIKTLICGLPSLEAVKPLEDELVQILRRPSKFSVVDLAEDLFSRRLERFIEDDLQTQLSEQIKSIKDLPLALDLLWNILTTSELVQSDSEALANSSVPLHNLTILSQMLLSDLLMNSIETRYQLIKNVVVLMLYLYGEEEIDDLFEDFPSLVSKYMASFHQAWILRWVSQQSSRVSPELAFEIEDNLVEKLTGLHVSAHSLENAQVTEAASATSLLSSLLLTKFVPELQPEFTPAICLTQAGSRFLDESGLVRNLSMMVEEKVEEMNMIKTSARNVQFVHFLLQVGLSSLALELVELYPDCGAGMTFLKGLALLELGEVEDAEVCLIKASSALYDPNFEMDDDSGLVRVLPAEASRGLSAYYSYVVSVLEPIGADLAIARFCQLALDSWEEVDEEADESRTGSVELWSKMFKCLVNLRMWDEAYQVLVSVPSTEAKHNSLRILVSSMCEANEVDQLLRFSFMGMQSEFERTLSFRARNSDPMSTPNYYQILYAYHITKGDYRSAGLAMYQHGRRIGDMATKGDAFQFLITQQCQSYLASINALSLAPPAHAWIPMACPKQPLATAPEKTHPDVTLARKRRRVTYYVPDADFAPGTLDLDALTLADIRQEYTLALARLQLANSLPAAAAAAAHLDGPTLVPMLLNAGRVSEALDKAAVLDTDRVPIFATLAESCCRLSCDGEENASGFDRDWVLADARAVAWDGSLAARAWKLLQSHLSRALPLSTGGEEAWKAREAVLEAVLATGGVVQLPRWVTEDFRKGARPERLVKKLIRYGMYEEACEVTIEWILCESELDKKSAGGWPIEIVDELLGCESGDGGRERLREVFEARLTSLGKKGMGMMSGGSSGGGVNLVGR